MPRNFNEIERRHGIIWRFDTARYSFCDQRDIEYASDGDPAHWFCAFVGIFDEDGECIGRDVLGGCSYSSFREFYSAHRWQYSRNQRKWITDPRSRAWKACETRRPRRFRW